MTYGIAIFLGAFLLFQVQLIMGKYILPLFGGAPAIWTTSMLCFQVLLLLGYAYAHLSSSRSGSKVQGNLHTSLLIGSLVVLLALWVVWGTPLTPGPSWKLRPDENPVWKILELLCVTVGLPFFLLSTTGPLLQRWFFCLHPKSSVYRLYGISNAGSLLGLLTYPFFFEWTLTIKQQARMWSLGYVVFVGLAAWIAYGHMRHAGHPQESGAVPFATEESPGRHRPVRQWLWVALSSVSSIMLLATTNRFSQDVAVIPLLWVLSLSIYLLSFILTFESTRWYSRKIFWPLYFLAVAMKVSFPGTRGEPLPQIGIYGLTLFALCMVCHGELARLKPAPQYLTRFYLMVAVGGAVGGTFVALGAPHLFRDFWEFQVALFGCGLLLFVIFLIDTAGARGEGPAWEYSLTVLIALFVPQVLAILAIAGSTSMMSRYTLAAGGLVIVFREIFARFRGNQHRETFSSQAPWKPVAAMALFGFFAIIVYAQTALESEDVIMKERNFFGVKYVSNDDTMINFLSASTVHGGEFKDTAKRSTPTWYYRHSSGAGLLISNLPRGPKGEGKLRVGLIGLGVGTLAAYGQPGDYYRFYEIDPAVIQMSAGPRPVFHFIADSRATVEIVAGDARLSMEREEQRGAAQNFDALMVDAFSGDAIPVHLLTREAMQIYLYHVKVPDGVLAFHISNRFLNLAPVVQGLAEAHHLASVQVRDKLSLWILLSKNPAMLQLPNLKDRTTSVVPNRKAFQWTDDYSNLFQILQRPENDRLTAARPASTRQN
ncbi:MAG: hypothetical protein NVS9B4_26590 [Candidatus Acidiferrum sp.]